MLEFNIQVLVTIGVAFASFIILHAISFRLNLRIRLSASGQVLLIMNGLLMNILLILTYARISYENQECVWGLAYILIVFNGLTYMYFHFYNMSETARRIRLLILIHTSSAAINGDNLNSSYDVTGMVRLRLQRLQAMWQISQSEGKYFVIGRILLFGAFALNWWRNLLGIKQ